MVITCATYTSLAQCEAIEMQEYDFTLHNRSNRTIPVKPAPVIVIEGLFALYDADLCDMMSLKIYVDTASDIRFIRRMQRDITERDRSVVSVVSQYLETCARCTSNSSNRPSATPTSLFRMALMARRSI